MAGSASGIEAATAVRLGEEDADVVLGDINEEGAWVTGQVWSVNGGAFFRE